MNTNPINSSLYNANKNMNQRKGHSANAAGFGVAAGDYAACGIDLNEQLVQNQQATFFMRVNSDAMVGAGINSGDVVIVDRSLTPASGKVVIAVLNGEMLIRRLYITGKKQRLLPETNKLAAIDIDPFAEFSVWGVVTYVIHQV